MGKIDRGWSIECTNGDSKFRQSSVFFIRLGIDVPILIIWWFRSGSSMGTTRSWALKTGARGSSTPPWTGSPSSSSLPSPGNPFQVHSPYIIGSEVPLPHPGQVLPPALLSRLLGTRSRYIHLILLVVRFLYPTLDRFSLQLFSPVSWEPVPGTFTVYYW